MIIDLHSIFLVASVDLEHVASLLEENFLPLDEVFFNAKIQPINHLFLALIISSYKKVPV
jgi:hypothetical protein